MCDCIEKIEKQVFDKLKKDKENNGIVNKASFKEKGYDLTNGTIRLYNEVEYEMTNKKVNGTLGATRNYTVSIYHSFCPFCGKSIEKKSTMKSVN